MKFVPMAELLERAAAGGYAVPSICAWSAEVVETVLGVAEELRAPVILMNGHSEFPLLAPGTIGPVAMAIAARFTVPAALHCDHGLSIEQVQECLDAGYTSVMLDYSNRPFAENAAGLQEVVRRARPLGVTVEGELGHVGKVGDSVEGEGEAQLTDPEEAAAYVEQTGVDALAVAIGNAHGTYSRLPQLDFERLARLHEAVRAPLVLHGGTGTPEADLARAISLGVAKVNVATEHIMAVRESLQRQWGEGRNLWTPLAQAEAMRAVAEVAAKWIRRTGAAGKA